MSFPRSESIISRYTATVFYTVTDKHLRISFDLDDTLICLQPGSPVEPNRIPLLLRAFFTERLRLGTVAMIHELERNGWEICIYTTSHRSPQRIRWWFRFYGIRIKEVVNQRQHEQQLKRNAIQHHASKYPSAFGIVLHVDDSEGVRREGLELGFNVVVVSPHDQEWTIRVLETASSIRSQLHYMI